MISCIHLAEMSDQPMVSVQVVPFKSGAHAGLLAHFAIAGLEGMRDTLYLETATVGQVIEVPCDRRPGRANLRDASL